MSSSLSVLKFKLATRLMASCYRKTMDIKKCRRLSGLLGRLLRDFKESVHNPHCFSNEFTVTKTAITFNRTMACLNLLHS